MSRKPKKYSRVLFEMNKELRNHIYKIKSIFSPNPL